MRITKAFDRCQLEGTEATLPCLHSKQSSLGVLGTSVSWSLYSQFLPEVHECAQPVSGSVL